MTNCFGHSGDAFRPTLKGPGGPRGFTLIELLIVVGIIAILAAIALPNFLEAQVRAKVSRTRADLRTLATAMEAYAVDYNGYPPDYDAGIYPGVTISNNESLTYRCLTTPVAFLSSPPLDVFRQGEPRLRLFEYYGEASVLFYNSGDWADTWTGRGIKWYAYSYGPNRENDLLAQDQSLAVLRVYDPTNGTVSSGDLGRSNVGTAP